MYDDDNDAEQTEDNVDVEVQRNLSVRLDDSEITRFVMLCVFCFKMPQNTHKPEQRERCCTAQTVLHLTRNLRLQISQPVAIKHHTQTFWPKYSMLNYLPHM